MELAQPADIHSIRIHNRADSPSRLNGAGLYVSDRPYSAGLDEADRVATLTGSSAVQEVAFPLVARGPYVLVKAAGANCLHLAELEVLVYADGGPAAPAFPQAAYSLSLPLKAPSGTALGSLVALDYHGDPLSYRTEGSTPFAIDSAGTLTLSEPVDHNQVGRFDFQVVASDGQHEAAVPVTVFVGQGPGVALERWTGISGGSVSDLTGSPRFLAAPDQTGTLTAFDIPSTGLDSYGQRLSGLLMPQTSEVCTFAVVGDDGTELRLAADGVPAHAIKVASKSGYGAYRDWNAAAKSAPVTLQAGRPVYLEVLHKEGGGGDHVSLGWCCGAATDFTPVPAELLHRDSVSAGALAPVFAALDYGFALPLRSPVGTRVGQVAAQDLQGDALSLSLLGDGSAAVSFAVAADGSITITEPLDHNRVQSVRFTVRASDGTHSTLAPVTVTLGAGQGVVQERWEGISGSKVSDLTGHADFQGPADRTATLAGLEAPDADLSNYGQRLRTWFVPQASGVYRFALSGDDRAELKLSADASPGGAQTIARLQGAVGLRDYAAGAQSEPLLLQGGRAYYLEVLHKEGSGADHVSVGIQKDGEAGFAPLPAGRLYQDATGAGAVAPSFAGGPTLVGLRWDAVPGQVVAQISATDLQGDALTYSLSGAGPFAVDASGRVTVTGPLAPGGYDITVTASDGVHSAAQTLTVNVPQADLVEQIVASGDVTLVPGYDPTPDLIEEALVALETLRTFGDPIRTALFGLEPDGAANGDSLTAIDWNPTHDAATLNPMALSNQAVLTTNAVSQTGYAVKAKPIAVAGERDGGRYLVMGGHPMRTASGMNEAMQRFMERSLAWLTRRDDLHQSGFDAVIAQMDESHWFKDESSTRTWLDARYPGLARTNAADACDGAALQGCLEAGADLLIVSQVGNPADIPAVTAAVEYALAHGIGVLYVHHDGDLKPLGAALFPLFDVTYGGDNYWERLSLDDFDGSGLATLTAEQQALGTTLRHLRDRDFALDMAAGLDAEGLVTLASVPGYADAFGTGAALVRGMLTGLESKGVAIFVDPGRYRLEKLLALIGDALRQQTNLPMDILGSDQNAWLAAYFADHAAYNMRSINPAQPDLGDAGRSDYSHVQTTTRDLSLDMAYSGRKATGAYALPGRAFTVTRTDGHADITVKLHIGHLFSHSMHETRLGNQYRRPKYLTSEWVTLAPGQSLTLTSAYGGMIGLDTSKSSDPAKRIELRFEGVGEHPFYAGPEDRERFLARLYSGDWDWAQLVTEGVEVHLPAATMRDSIEELADSRGWDLAELARVTQDGYLEGTMALSGYIGTGLPRSAQVDAFCAARGWDCGNAAIHGFHATREGYQQDATPCWGAAGCSTWPVTGVWGWDPLGAGQVHELGHHIEGNGGAGYQVFANMEGHHLTNLWRMVAPRRYFKETGRYGACDVDAARLNTEEKLEYLNDAISQADPYQYLQETYWAEAHRGYSSQDAWIQMVAQAERLGSFEDGWDALTLFLTMAREYKALIDGAEVDFESRKAAYGFAGYTQAEAKALVGTGAGKSAWALIAYSLITGHDQRAFFTLLGLPFDPKAANAVAALGLPPAPAHYYVFGDVCALGEAVAVPVNGQSTWPTQVPRTVDTAPADADRDGLADASDPNGQDGPLGDLDGDTVANAYDLCPSDAAKRLPGACGCGAAERDGDFDGIADCTDGAPNDGLLGDSDGDGALNLDDLCPIDPAKVEPLACGCGLAESDRDGDALVDCQDPDTHDGPLGDADGDGLANGLDQCPIDPAKSAPLACGCGAPETDSDADGLADCVDPRDDRVVIPQPLGDHGFESCAVVGGDAGALEGVAGRTARFNGNGDLVDLGKDYSFSMQQPFSLSLWFNPAQIKTMPIVSKTDYEYSLLIYGDKLRFVYWNTNGYKAIAVDSSLPLEPNRWYHAVVTHDPATGPALYLDGVDVTVIDRYAPTETLKDRSGATKVGGGYHYNGSTGGNGWFHGQADELTVFDGALSPEQVERLWSNGLDGLAYDALDREPLACVDPDPTWTNLAQGKTATQGATYGSGAAARAVDGRRDGTYNLGYVTHTTANATNNWWQLDLGAERDIGTIQVFNRSDCCRERLIGAKVYVGSTPYSGSLAAFQEIGTLDDRAPRQTIALSVPVTARYVVVKAAGSNHLSLAEVEVYAEISE